MKTFHIGDVLSITTGRLVSPTHMAGIYCILNFMVNDDLTTLALPRVAKECEPWLRTQFPQLFPENPKMAGLLEGLTSCLATSTDRDATCARWVESVRLSFGLPDHLPVYELSEDMHTRINPVEEAIAMIGKDRVIVIEKPEESV